jgi:hypothetical protein
MRPPVEKMVYGFLIGFFFHPSLLLLFMDPGSEMGKNQDPGSWINIPDPQHWCYIIGTGII